MLAYEIAVACLNVSTGCKGHCFVGITGIEIWHNGHTCLDLNCVVIGIFQIRLILIPGKNCLRKQCRSEN